MFCFVFREDGKDSIKFYTDSHFFVDFWYAEMQKDIEQKKTEIKARKKRVSFSLFESTLLTNKFLVFVFSIFFFNLFHSFNLKNVYIYICDLLCTLVL